MSIKVTDQMKQEIKRLNPLKDVLAEYGYTVTDDKVVCPFHRDDDDPSMHIYEPNPDHSEDNYHCYGCHAGQKGQTLKVYRGGDVFEVIDAGSDVIALVANYEQLSFPEACVRLMERAGLPVPIVNPVIEKAKLAVTAQNRFFWQHLQQDKDVLQYLHDRGLGDDDIATFRLGLVPNNHPVAHLRGKLVIGLIESGYDPKQAKTIAMAYRALDDSKPKYINDPTSSIYQKKHYVYGLTFARNPIRRKGYAIITEGYFDVMLAHKHGLDNTIATCGTAFTEEQMDELRKLTDKLIFWYDGDSAGHEAMERSLSALLQRGFSVLFVDSTPLDPAEMIQKLGGQKVTMWIVKHAKPALQVVIDRVADEFDTIINKASVEALDKLWPIVQACKRPSDEAVYRSYLKKRLHITLGG